MGKLLVLLSNRKEDRIFACSICLVAEMDLAEPSTADDAVKLMEENPGCIVLVNSSSEDLVADFQLSVINNLGLDSDRVQPNQIHFLSDLAISQSGSLVHNPLMGSFIRRDPKDPEESGAHYGRIVNAAALRKPFGLHEIFEGSAKVQKILMKNLSEKPAVIDAVKAYLAAANWTTRQASTILTALDELLINAAYDAPQAALETNNSAIKQNTHISQFAQETQIEIQLAFDGTFFGVSVTDFFGSLEKTKLMKHIPKNHTLTEYNPNSAGVMGGIGLSMVYQTGGGLVFICQPGVKTESLVYYRQAERFKDFREQFRFVSTYFFN